MAHSSRLRVYSSYLKLEISECCHFFRMWIFLIIGCLGQLPRTSTNSGALKLTTRQTSISLKVWDIWPSWDFELAFSCPLRQIPWVFYSHLILPLIFVNSSVIVRGVHTYACKYSLKCQLSAGLNFFNNYCWFGPTKSITIYCSCNTMWDYICIYCMCVNRFRQSELSKVYICTCSVTVKCDTRLSLRFVIFATQYQKAKREKQWRT